jgi:uncharacterized protein (TIGR03437 family)
MPRMLKLCSYFSLGAALFSGPCRGADFLTGQAARAVIGQPFFNAQNFGASNTLLGGVGGLAYVNNSLLVVDGNRLGLTPVNNRVLIFNGIQQMFPAFDAEIPFYDGRCPVCGGQASVVVGQPDFGSTASTPISQTSMRTPTAVASDGRVLAVADTSNNRVLIWKSIPTVNGQPADVVLGQPNFTTVAGLTITASALRGPQGVWIQNGKLFVADTQNNRVLIWNSIPNQNNQPADLVLGQPNFTIAPQVNQVNLSLPATPNTMLSPTSVTSDGTRLYVSDLGFNRVLIWNSIPTATQQAADLEIGQKDLTQSVANDSPNLCPGGTDSNGNPIFPSMCGRTLSFPRYALSDGQRLFIADGGNDRVLVFNSIPTQNAPHADAVLGQVDEFSNTYTSSDLQVISAANVTPSPTSLAWDGQNLYVTDATDYRVLIFSPAHPDVPVNSVLNGASRAVFAFASVAVGGTVTTNDTATITINGTAFTYTVKANDTLETIGVGLTALINAGAGNPSVLAAEETGFATVRLVARQPGTTGNSITVATAVSTKATVTLTASNGNLTGGASGAQIAPGSIVVLRGSNLADSSASAPDAETLPFELAGVQLYFDGVRAGLFSVSPTEIRAQFPFVVTGANSVSAWVRTKHADGSVTVTTAINVEEVDIAPGLFGDETPGAPEPRTAIATHGSSFATATIPVTGTIQVGDKGTITIADSSYIYTVVTGDTLASVRDQFIAQINANPNSPVTASAIGTGIGIRLQAKVPGPSGNGTPISTSLSTSSNSGVQLLLTPNNTALCCANLAGASITPNNPAIPGETIVVYATGLGLTAPEAARQQIVDATKYRGTQLNAPRVDVTAIVESVAAPVIWSTLLVGQVSIYQVGLEISSSVTPNPQAPVTISQNFTSSNIVVIPIGNSTIGPAAFAANPNPITLAAGATVGQTTLSWNAPGLSGLQIWIGAGTTGTLFAGGLGTTGSVTTGNWVSEGMIFSLVDPAAGQTLSTITVHTAAGGQVTLAANPNPIALGAGATVGQTTLSWNAPGLSGLQIWVGPGTTGTLFAGGLGTTGFVTTGNWVTEGMIFSLVDPAAGQTLSTVTLHTTGGS